MTVYDGPIRHDRHRHDGVEHILNWRPCRNENLIEALEAGASGFLGKDVEPSDLLNAVRTMATEAGMVVLPPEVRDLIVQKTRGNAGNKTGLSGR